MRVTSKVAGGLLATVLMAGLVPAEPARGAPAGTYPAGKTGGSRTVTLVTGDRVTLSGNGPAATAPLTIERGEGRSSVTFLIARADGHLRVLPSDAGRLVATGRVDPRLFDVTQLLDFGYDDRRADLPLIVTYQAGAAGRNATRSHLAGGDAKVVRELPAADGFAVRAARAEGSAFWQGVTSGGDRDRKLDTGLAKMWLDGIRKLSLDKSVPQIGAPAAWAAGYTGKGVPVALLDSGVDSTHPDLAGHVTATANFTDDADAKDYYGHGTHVASTILGSGAAAGGRYRGVAPDAHLLAGKVCTGGGCPDSAILAGMQWAADQGAKIVNMSLGGTDTPEIDPIEQAINTLTQQRGMLFVVAAGNDGQDRSVNSPGSADAALTVGAVDRADQLADFSSRGPRIGDGALKPDITAPGVGIVAARSSTGSLGTPGESYVALSGTSMATPHVAGAAALLLQQHPDWSPETVKSTLMGSAQTNPALGATAQGAGRVDVARAITEDVTASPASVSFNAVPWPHDDDQPISRTVTYRNAGGADVTLALALRSTDAAGDPTPSGMFTISSASVTVPAGGQASVTLTVDTRLPGPDGYAGGHLVATGVGRTVTTPFAVDKEVESHNLTVSAIGLGGAPTGDADTLGLRLDAPGYFEVSGTAQPTTLRLPAGRWLLVSSVFDVAGEQAMLAYPRLDLHADRSVTMDATLAGPVSVTVPDADAVTATTEVMFWDTASDGFLGSGISTLNDKRVFTARIGPDPGTMTGAQTIISTQLARRDPAGGTSDSPYLYLLAWYEQGRMPTGYSRRVTAGDLATVRADYATQAPGLQVRTGSVAVSADGVFRTDYAVFESTAPFVRTEYRNTDRGGRWAELLNEGRVVKDETGVRNEVVGIAEQPPTAYRPGRHYDERWNRGVFGPALPPAGSSAPGMLRDGNLLVSQPSMYSDGDGRLGTSATATATTTLFRDGEQLASLPSLNTTFEVPPDEAAYRLRVVAERPAPGTLSTHSEATWSFRSASVEGAKPLPLSVVRFSPPLDATNSAPGGVPYRVPVSVQAQPGSAAGRVTSIQVDVSYDDGRTWSPVELRRDGAGWRATLQHPPGEGYVSFQARSTDSAGNSVEQRIIRAYHIAPTS